MVMGLPVSTSNDSVSERYFHLKDEVERGLRTGEQVSALCQVKPSALSQCPLCRAERTLLWGSVRGHGPLPHDMVARVDLTHHAHGILLALVVLPATPRGYVVLLGGRLLVHHGAWGRNNTNTQSMPLQNPI